MNELLALLDARLRDRCRSHLHLGAKGFEAALRRERVALADMLMHMLDAFELASSNAPNGFQGYAERQRAEPQARPEAQAEPPNGIRKTPTAEILERARKLQALAMGSTSAGERENAWAAFGKLWEEYVLPNDIGMR